MKAEQERWAEALTIDRMYGDDAPAWVADRIGDLASAGDAGGVARMLLIARRIDELRAAGVRLH